MNFDSYRKNDIESKLRIAQFRPLDVMVTGVTGAGKSTTLNSLFGKTIAKVGEGVDPETMELTPYNLNDVVRIWDTPGLGDGVEKDKIHKQKMTDLLCRTYPFNGNNYALIDMVLVIIEGSKRDMGTTYALIKDVLAPLIPNDRILVVINQADVAMSSHHWNYETNTPDSTLIDFLGKQAASIQSRIKEGTGIDIKRPVYYSAKYGYNMQTVFDFIVDHMLAEKRNLPEIEEEVWSCVYSGDVGFARLCVEGLKDARVRYQEHKERAEREPEFALMWKMDDFLGSMEEHDKKSIKYYEDMINDIPKRVRKQKRPINLSQEPIEDIFRKITF